MCSNNPDKKSFPTRTHISKEDKRKTIFKDALKLANFIRGYKKRWNGYPDEQTVMLHFGWSKRQLDPRDKIASAIIFRELRAPKYVALSRKSVLVKSD